MLDGAVLEDLASAPEITVGGEGACRTGLVSAAPELSVGGKGACRTGLFLRVSRRPQNHLSGAKERVGRGWLRLWGLAGAPSVDRSPKGDAPLSLELTVGSDGDAVDWYAPRSVTYSRRGGIKVPPDATHSPCRDLCALPWNDPSREARNG